MAKKIKVYANGYDIDYDKVKHGTKFTALIQGQACAGRISKNDDGDTYYCHDNPEVNGSHAQDLLGFEYSWYLDDDVKNVELGINTWTKAELNKLPLRIGEDVVEFKKDSIQVGCTTVSHTLIFKVVAKIKELKRKKAAKKTAKKKK
jgi:hypothetical protein